MKEIKVELNKIIETYKDKAQLSNLIQALKDLAGSDLEEREINLVLLKTVIDCYYKTGKQTFGELITTILRPDYSFYSDIIMDITRILKTANNISQIECIWEAGSYGQVHEEFGLIRVLECRYYGTSTRYQRNEIKTEKWMEDTLPNISLSCAVQKICDEFNPSEKLFTSFFSKSHPEDIQLRAKFLERFGGKNSNQVRMINVRDFGEFLLEIKSEKLLTTTFMKHLATIMAGFICSAYEKADDILKYLEKTKTNYETKFELQPLNNSQ